jgi:hypothetical protein
MIWKFIKHQFWTIFLSLVVVIIIGFNYQGGSWLSGWDNLHPEMGLNFNLKRAFFGVWQEYQGLGLLAGMGHSADLIRQICLRLMAVFVPVNCLRYGYVFLMLWLGTLGCYFLLRYLLKASLKTGWLAAIGAGYYLLNLATIQIFYTPYEAFVTHYGFLPWLVLVLIRYLDKPNQRNLISLGLVNLLGVAQFYVPTMFLVYLIVLGLVILTKLKAAGRSMLAKGIKSLGIILLLNAFWLLPFLYFSLRNIQVPLASQSNYLSSETMKLKNKQFGRWQDVAWLKSYWLDYVEQSNGEYQYLAGVWRDHLNQSSVVIGGWILFGGIILGIIYAWRKRPKYWLSFVCLWGLSWLILANDTPPFSWIDWFWRRIPVLDQAFRSPFTKFGNLVALVNAVLLAWGLTLIRDWLNRAGKRLGQIGTASLGVILATVLVLFCWPVFKGKLIDSNLRSEIPKEYFELFEFFRQQDKNQRITNLPQPSLWGWTYYSWGMRGSGFLWYGIEQPIMDRAFDVWSGDNENFYWQISQAIQAEDKDLFKAVLAKYQLNWLVVDENIRGGSSYKSLSLEEIEEMLGQQETARMVKQLGKIKVYQLEQEKVKDFVTVLDNLPQIGPQSVWNNQDQAYLDYGDYVISSKPEVYYPFRSLFTGRQQEELEFKVEDQGQSLVFSASAPETLAGYSLILPDLRPEEKQGWTKTLEPVALKGPDVTWDKDSLTVRLAKQSGYFSYDSGINRESFSLQPESCNPFNTGKMEREIVTSEGQIWLNFKSQGSSNCLGINLPQLSHQLGYLVKIKAKYIKGKTLLFYVLNQESDSRVIETQLPKTEGEFYFIIPPLAEDGLGYSLNFDNISIGREETINELGRVELAPIPYSFLKEIKLVKEAVEPAIAWDKTEFKVSHPNPSYYQIELAKPSNETSTLVLSQSYDEGWLAWEGKPFIGKRLKNHVLVNNWANGWSLAGVQADKIYLCYWPQGLEYLGFAILGFSGLWLLLAGRSRKQR